MIFRSRPLHSSANVDIKIRQCLGHYVLGTTADVVDDVDLDVDMIMMMILSFDNV